MLIAVRCPVSAIVKGPVVNGGNLQLGDLGSSPWEQKVSFVKSEYLPWAPGYVDILKREDGPSCVHSFRTCHWSLEAKQRGSSVVNMKKVVSVHRNTLLSFLGIDL